MCGKLKPPNRFGLVLRQAAAALQIKKREIELAVYAALIGGEAKEAGGLDLVLGQAAAACHIESAKVVHAFSTALLDRPLIEPDRLLITAWDATDTLVRGEAEIRQSIAIALIRREAEKTNGLAFVTRQPPAPNCVE